MLDNLQEMLSTLDFAQIEADVVASMKAGTNALNVLHKHMQAEDVEKVMDEAFDAIRISRDVMELLGEPLSAVDEDAILVEMASWEGVQQTEKDLEQQQLAGVKVPQHPVNKDPLKIPSHEIVTEENPSAADKDENRRVAA
jgi:hypothetical protein